MHGVALPNSVQTQVNLTELALFSIPPATFPHGLCELKYIVKFQFFCEFVTQMHFRLGGW